MSPATTETTDAPPELVPHGSNAIDEAARIGDAQAASHTCADCDRCPHCAPLHRRMAGLSASQRALKRSPHEQLLENEFTRQAFFFERQLLVEPRNRWIAALGAFRAASAAVDAMLADHPWLPGGVGLDPSRFSLVPVDGWIEVTVGTGSSMWVASEDLRDEAQRLVQSTQTHAAYEAALNAASDARGRLEQAKADFAAAQQAYDAELARVRRWVDGQKAIVDVELQRLTALLAQVRQAHLRCLEECAAGGGGKDAFSPLAAALGVIGVVAGALTVIAGQPFDTGTEAVAAPIVDEDPIPDEQPTADLPALTLDHGTAMIDSFFDGIHGISTQDQPLAPYLDPELTEKFTLFEVDSPYRTSFATDTLETLDLFPGVNGDPVPLTHAGVTTLTFREPTPTPITSILQQYGPQAALGFGQTQTETGTADQVHAFTFRHDGDLLAAEFCGGRVIVFGVGIVDPTGPGTFTAEDQFPADYYTGGNRFVNFALRDCEPAATFVDEYDGTGIAGGNPTESGGIFTTAGGDTTATFFLPDSLVPPGSMVRQQVFEVPDNQPFAIDNTRFQSTPDVFDGFRTMSDAVTTDDCDFTIAFPPVGDPGTTSGDPTGGDSTAGDPTGGGTPDPGSGTDTDPGSDTTTGGGTNSGTGATGDPDETDGLLVGVGLGTGAFGGGLLAMAYADRPTGRREDGDEATDTHADDPPGAAPPSGPEPPTTDLPGGQQLRDITEELAAAETAARDATLDAARTRMAEAEAEYVTAASTRAARQASIDDAGMFDSFTGWYSGRNEVEVSRLAQETEREAAAYDALRKATSEYMALRVLTAPDGDRSAVVQRLHREAPDRDALGREAHREYLRVHHLGADDPARTSVESAHRTKLRAAQVWVESLAILESRIDPSSTFRVLTQIENNIASTAEQRTHKPGETEAEYDAREWLRDVRRELAVETGVALAEQATVIDPRDGTVVHGGLRSRFAADRIEAFAGTLEHSAWRNHDPRSAQAQSLRARLSHAYAALDYLGAGDVSMAEYFLAVSATIRDKQRQTNELFVSDYLGLPVETDGGWWDTIKVGWSVKLGTTGRAMGFGDDDVDAVRERIYTMNVEADAAVDALTKAAQTPDPDDLPAEVATTLEAFGYIERRRDGTASYRMPTQEHTASRVAGLRLPGASWLDVVSVQNASEILVSVALPELAAIRLSAMASRLGASTRMVMLTKAVADQGLGLAADMTFAYAHSDGEFSLGKTAFDSFVASWAGAFTRKGSDALVTGVGERALGDIVTDDKTRQLMLGVVSEVFAVPADTAQGLLIAAASGESFTSDDVLAALVGSAMNNYLGRLGTGTADQLDAALRFLPPGLREHSLLLGPTMRDAIRHDASLNRKANAAFGSVLPGGALDRAAGTKVFEALRLGDLTWSQLQRVYTIRGSELHTVMDQVRIERDRFAKSVAQRARQVAIHDITTEFDRRIAAAPASEHAVIEGERAAELDKIAPLDHVAVAVTDHFMDKVTVQAETRQELLDRLGNQSDHADLTVDQLRTLATDAVDAALAKRVEKPGDVIQPGSAGATSDIDRSWASEFLRRAATKVIQLDMVTGRMDGGLGPTTARAFDLNEYMNVMTRIKGVIEGRRDSFAHLDGATVQVDGRGVTPSHANTVEANSLAAAMLHMNETRRRRFEANLRSGLEGEALTRHEAMFAHARRELATSVETLQRYVAEEAERLGTSVDDPDTQLRARERLYGDRMAELDAIGRRIDAATDAGTRAELMAEWERTMNTALRDGIETYSDMANLDIIVDRLQGERNDDGSKKTIDELMRSDLRGEGGALAHLTDQQFRSMLNDQILMLMHHVEAYQQGHESAAKATRSLAKYGERAILALHLLGDYHPDQGGSYSPLHDAVRRLIRFKDEPERLVRELNTLTPSDDTDVNLRHLLDLIETIPGMEGLTAGPALLGPGAGFGNSIAGRDWTKRRRAAEEAGVYESVVAGELVDLSADLAEVERTLTRLRRLQTFAPPDREVAERLLQVESELTVRQNWLDPRGIPTRGHGGGLRSELRAEMAETQKALRAMRGRARAAPDPSFDARIEGLEARRDGLRARVDALHADLSGR